MSHSTQHPTPCATEEVNNMIALCGPENSLSTIDLPGQRYQMSGDRCHVDQQIDMMENRLDECVSSIRKNRQEMEDLKNLMAENTSKSKVLFSNNILF